MVTGIDGDASLDLQRKDAQRFNISETYAIWSVYKMNESNERAS